MNVARYLVQGVDVWLNTPRRPLEASGTSGMKAAVNGALNLSILDGWWAEGYARSSAGPSAGPGAAGRGDPGRRDAEALYRLLEREVVPRFYDRGPDGLPSAWLGMMRASMAMARSRFTRTGWCASTPRRCTCRRTATAAGPPESPPWPRGGRRAAGPRARGRTPRHGPSTPASRKVAISRNRTAAASITGSASSPPEASPSRSRRSSTGSRPSSARTRS